MAIVIKAPGNRKDCPRSYHSPAPHRINVVLSAAMPFAIANRKTDVMG